MAFVNKEYLLKAFDAFNDAEHAPKGWISAMNTAREMLVDKTVEILYDHYECSLCRCTLPNLLYNKDGKPIYKFCPNCGAKMEEE